MQDSEAIHNRTIALLARASRFFAARKLLTTLYSAPALPIELFGLRFPNPIGLAAGMDKHAAAVPIWEALGFGFCEIGGVTWHAQPGNPAPRMFRAVAEEALINRMGFNNPGAEAIARQLEEWRGSDLWPKHPVGINLGRSKVTPNDKAAEEYAKSFRSLRSLADFFVVNVSSPNTPNLRELQDKEALDEILNALQEANTRRQTLMHVNQSVGDVLSLPLLIKVAPDLSFQALDEILEIAARRNLAGIVATNTTITRPDSSDARCRDIYAEAGGLSGRPLRARSTEVIRHIYRQTKGGLPIIGVGGVFNADDAWEKITAGASLVQLYTGLVYEGPGVTRAIVRGLGDRLARHGLRSIREAVGTDAQP